MEIWKLVILGISGDLAKLKILPAVAQFAAKNEDKVQIDLIGYSRHLPEIESIKSVLNITDQNQEIPGIRSIKLVKGEYDDYKFFDDLYGSLQENERAVIYMSVPPLVFLDFIKDSCPYNTHNIDILVEKPFGENYAQVQKIFDTISRCKLYQNVHFCDHYMFKTETNLDKLELANLKFLDNLKLKNIKIKILEKLGVEGRIGYFDKVGTFLDIIIHISSLLGLSLKSFKPELVDFSVEDIKVDEFTLGQYESYKRNPEVQDSSVDTYFNLKLKIADLPVEMESGKELSDKVTEISCEFDQETSLRWQIYPEKRLEVISPEKNLSLSLDKNDNLDHTNIFEQLLANDYKNFLSKEEALKSWQIIDKVLEFKDDKNILPQIYKNGKYPVDFIE